MEGWTLPTPADIADWFMGFWGAIDQGFIVGLALGGVLPLGIILLVLLVRARRARRSAIEIEVEQGQLIVRIAAIRQFLTRITSEFPQASLRTVDLRRRGGRHLIKAVVNVVPGAHLVALKRDLTKRILEEIAAKIGMDATKIRVDVEISDWSAKSERIAKQMRKVQRERLLPVGHDEEPESVGPAAQVDPVRQPAPAEADRADESPADGGHDGESPDDGGESAEDAPTPTPTITIRP